MTDEKDIVARLMELHSGGRQNGKSTAWQAAAEITRLRAENERLMEALGVACSRGCDHCTGVVRRARAALAEKEEV